jgi:general secretion pathway protein K
MPRFPGDGQTMSAVGPRQRGFALLIVLWTLVLISLVVAHLTSTGRSEARIAGNLEKAAVAEAAADGVTFETIYRLLDNAKLRWPLTDAKYHLKLDRGAAEITIVSENGKINPNSATPELLAALIHLTGVDNGTAGRLGAAIADWREPGDDPRPGGAKLAQYQAAGMDHSPPGEPFQTIDELGRVLGMTPKILAAIRPYLSLYQIGLPDPTLAAPIVVQAMKQNGLSPDDEEIRPASATAVTITARVSMNSGGEFVRRAIVRVGSSFQNGFVILSWDTDAD